MCRQTIVENDDYTFDLEYGGGQVFAHLYVSNYNRKVYDHMVDTWLDTEEALREHGFEYVLAIPEKTGLVKKMGWEKLMDIEVKGKEMEVFVWDLL